MRKRLGDRDVPVPPPLQEVHLLVTPLQVLNARGNKAIGFLPMHPLELLALTTTSDEHVQEIIGETPDRKGKKVSLETYNKAALEGENIIPPFLRVDMATGEVKAHEGRHRSGALYRADPEALLWVAIELLDKWGYAIYYEEEPYPSMKKRYLDEEDVPKIFIGQFRPIEVEVDPSTMWLIKR